MSVTENRGYLARAARSVTARLCATKFSITKLAIRRLARRGGGKRISGLFYEETCGVLEVFLEHIIRDAVTYTEHARRETAAMDVAALLR